MLGGGGSTGNAWLIGVIAGMLATGLDVTSADLTVGTSAGATAAAQLSGSSPAELLDAILAGSAGSSSTEARPAMRPVPDQLARLRALIAGSVDAAGYRRTLGAAALEMLAASDGSWQPQWRATVASRLPQVQWPAALAITALDAGTGEPVVFNAHSGVDLVDAVAASCSSAVPYRIGGRHYIDGGFRTNADNADLAQGCARVLVLSPLSGSSLTPVSWGLHLATQVRSLRAAGSRVCTVFPERNAEHLFGANGMDISLRPAAARAGYAQGHVLAEELKGFWE